MTGVCNDYSIANAKICITGKLQKYYNYIKNKKGIAKSKIIRYTKDKYITSYVQRRKILKKSKKVLQNSSKMWYIIGKNGIIHNTT